MIKIYRNRIQCKANMACLFNGLDDTSLDYIEKGKDYSNALSNIVHIFLILFAKIFVFFSCSCQWKEIMKSKVRPSKNTVQRQNISYVLV